MANQVKTDFIVGKNTVGDALRKMSDQTQKLTGRQTKLGRESERAAKKAERGLGNMRRAALSAAGGYLGLSKAIQLGNQALEKQIELQKASKDAQLTLAQAQSKLLINLGDITTKQQDVFFAGLKDIRKEAELSSLAPLTLAASNILSALGGEPAEKRKRALQIARASAPFFRQDPEGLTEFGGALGDISTATGQTPERSLGFALSVLGSARIQELGGLSVLAPLISGAEEVRQPGVDKFLQARQAGAFAAGFGTIAADRLGRRTGTTGATLFPKLAAATPGGSIFEQIERVRADESGELREEILAGAFSAKEKPFVRSLLTGTGGRTGEAIREAFPTIKADVPAAQALAERLRSGTFALETATFESERLGRKEALQLRATGRTRAQLARDILTDVLEETRTGPGAGFVRRATDIFVGVTGADPVQAAIEQVQVEITRARGGVLGTGARLDPETIETLRASLRQLEQLNSKTPAVRVSSEGDE